VLEAYGVSWARWETYDLGWLGLLLSVLFTAMMWTVLKPYRRLTSLVTGNPVETPRQALNRLKAQAARLRRADPTDTTAADATTTAPDPVPATGTVAVRFRPATPDHTPIWAREGDHDDEHDDLEGGPQETSMATRPHLDQDPRVDVRQISAVPAAKFAMRSLDDLDSLRGATPEEIRGLVPRGWIEKPLKKGDGVRFLNPERPGESISVEGGWPGHVDPLHSGPYVKISRDGMIERIPLQGSPALEDR
jgi:hypothetical protein